MTFFISPDSELGFCGINHMLHKINSHLFDYQPMSVAITEYQRDEWSGCGGGMHIVDSLRFFWNNIVSVDIRVRKILPGEHVGIFVTVEPATVEMEHTLRPEHRQGD